MKIKNKKYPKQLIIPLIAGGVLLAIGIPAVIYFTQRGDDTTTTDPSEYINKPISNGVDFSGPSSADLEDNKLQEQKDAERAELDKQPIATNAIIIITNAAQFEKTVEARAYINNLYESGGKCTATYTKAGEQPVSITSSAIPDAKSIQCGILDIARDPFPAAGNWSLQITYSSPKASRNSNSQTVVVK